MPAPVNVKLQSPTIAIPNWSLEASEWLNRNREIGGNPDFFPLTIKAAYVIGIIHDLCESVSHLLSHPNAKSITYIPAYGVFASGVELLGRCINGNINTSNSTNDLKNGFKWLANSSYIAIQDSHMLITTNSFAYTIEMLTALRHFAAHGQATSTKTRAGTYQFGNIDYEILGKMPPLIADGLERYWKGLMPESPNAENLCNNLAEANVIALRNWPVDKSWQLFEKDKAGKHNSVAEIFGKFEWRV